MTAQGRADYVPFSSTSFRRKRGITLGAASALSFAVIPAKAGIHFDLRMPSIFCSSFRRKLESGSRLPGVILWLPSLHKQGSDPLPAEERKAEDNKKNKIEMDSRFRGNGVK